MSRAVWARNPLTPTLKTDTAEMKVFPSQHHKTKVGSAIRQLYIKTVLFISAPNSHKQGTFSISATHAWNGTLQELGWLWLQAAIHPVTESPVLQSLLSLRNAANDPQHLGLCDNQVSCDLKSGNEGTQLNLLTGAHRKSVPKRNQTKGKNREHHRQLPFDKTTKEIKDRICWRTGRR